MPEDVAAPTSPVAYNPKCRACRWHKYARGVCVPAEGSWTPDLVIVGEAPGIEEDRKRRPFIGPTGAFLKRLLEIEGIDLSRVLLTNTVRCWPPEIKHLTTDEFYRCIYLYLRKELAVTHPAPVLCLGATACKWAGGRPSVRDVEGTAWEKDGRLFIGCYHPAAALRGKVAKQRIVNALKLAKRLIGQTRLPSRIDVREVARPSCAVDTETTGLYRHLGHRAFLASTACQKESRLWKLPFEAPALHEYLGQFPILDFWNAPFDVPVLGVEGVRVPWEKVHDVQVDKALHDENDSPFRLKPCAKRYLALGRTAADRLYEFWKKRKDLNRDFVKTPSFLVDPYALEDAELTFGLAPIFEPTEPDLKRVSQIEHRIQPLLVGMYDLGVGLDVPYVHRALKRIANKKDLAYKALNGVNPNSPDQLTKAFNLVGVHSNFRTPTGKESWAEEALVATNHPLAQAILFFRSIEGEEKFLNMFLKYEHQGTLHPGLNQTGTETGRLGGGKPYLLNLTKDEGEGHFDLVRRAIVARPGWEIWSFDWCQLQLRLFAEIVGEKNMVQALIDGYPKYDPYQIIADRVGISRDQSKTLNLATLFGAGAETLARNLSIPLHEVEGFLAEFKVQFPRMAAAPYAVRRMLEKQGYVSTWLGRRRRIHPEGANQAVNFLAQGGEADMLKVVMLRTDDVLQAHGRRARMILPVHDQLLFEGRKEDRAAIIPDLWEAMTQGWPFRVPIDAAVSVGPSWGQLEDLPRVTYDRRAA